MTEMGLVHVYTGSGKGKTTSAVGLSARASGRGMKVLFIQFMKGGVVYGELASLDKLGVEVHQFGRPDFVDHEDPDPVDVRMAQEGLDFASKRISTGDYDMVVLDEINVATAWNLLDESEVLTIVNNRPKGTEIILTGRYAPDSFLEIADLVTEMVEVKHYYSNGIEARDGIER